MINKHSFTILLGGNLTVTPRLIAQVSGSRIIAADSGMRHAAGLGLEPELWVGDFDSADSALLATHGHVPRQSYSTAKDATDGAIAIEAALARGAKKILLVGALGGRFDHALAHGLQLLSLAAQGFAAYASSGDEELYPLINHLALPDLPQGARISVLGLGELEGLSMAGVRWPLEQRNVHLGSTLTISNEATGPVTIRLEHGQALVTVHPDAKA